MTTILDAALEILNQFGPPPLPITIIVTAFVDGVYVLEDGGRQYIIASEWVLDALRKEFAPPPGSVLGLSALSGIPVMQDDRLAAALLAKKLIGGKDAST